MKIVLSDFVINSTNVGLEMKSKFFYEQMSRLIEKELLKRGATCKIEVVK